MAKEREKDEAYTYYIPNNFTDSGRLFSGMVDVRNFIEAIIACSIIIFLQINYLDIPFKTRVMVFIFTVVPVFALFIFGIARDSVTQFIINFIKYLIKRRYLHLKGVNVHDVTTGNKKEGTVLSETKEKASHKSKNPNK